MTRNYDFITEAFAQTRMQMTAMIGRMMHSNEEAADIIQESFCRLWPRRDTIGNKNEAAALATTTAKNICIDRIRSNARHMSVSVDEDRDTSEVIGVDTTLEVKEQYEIVTKIINERLSETQRKVMQMKEYDDMSIEEIAHELQMEESAVRMNISRARKAIRELYQEVNK